MVLRRFGGNAGLLFALVGEQERELQDAVLRGPPPLGPGVAPGERLAAFLEALVELTEEHADLLLASETAKPGARYRTGPYAAWHQHAAVLIRQARPDANAPLLAHFLLAPLAAESYHRLRQVEGWSRDDFRAALADLAGRGLA